MSDNTEKYDGASGCTTQNPGRTSTQRPGATSTQRPTKDDKKSALKYFESDNKSKRYNAEDYIKLDDVPENPETGLPGYYMQSEDRYEFQQLYDGIFAFSNSNATLPWFLYKKLLSCLYFQSFYSKAAKQEITRCIRDLSFYREFFDKEAELFRRMDEKRNEMIVFQKNTDKFELNCNNFKFAQKHKWQIKRNEYEKLLTEYKSLRKEYWGEISQMKYTINERSPSLYRDLNLYREYQKKQLEMFNLAIIHNNKTEKKQVEASTESELSHKIAELNHRKKIDIIGTISAILILDCAVLFCGNNEKWHEKYDMIIKSRTNNDKYAIVRSVYEKWHCAENSPRLDSFIYSQIAELADSVGYSEVAEAYREDAAALSRATYSNVILPIYNHNNVIRQI